MLELSCVILSRVLSLLKASFLGSHWPSRTQKTQPIPGVGGNLNYWAQKSKGKDASTGCPGAQGTPGLRAQ